MQIVYISNRPETAAGTLAFVEALMPFVEEAVVVCPGGLVERFGHPGRLAVTTVAEEDLLSGDLARFAASNDHQFKNWLLRSALPRLDALGDTFLMSDDDSRPLARVHRELFVEDGRHHAFYTYDLRHWSARETDYDAGQHATREALSRRGLPTLSYSAHMPQIVDKALLADVAERFAEETERGVALDEWSVYFNAARAIRPRRFHPPRPYLTLCWPALPTDWQAGARPAEFRFENYHPALYERGGLFEGIPPGFDAETWRRSAAEKIRRRQTAQAVYDSATARLLRRAAWGLRRAVLAGRTRFGHRSVLSSAARRALPAPLRRLLRGAERHGDDPAWSFRWLMARRRR